MFKSHLVYDGNSKCVMNDVNMKTEKQSNDDGMIYNVICIFIIDICV